jgi:adenine/guanine phosphoribosyltransferase-like PRPP-binding protein
MIRYFDKAFSPRPVLGERAMRAMIHRLAQKVGSFKPQMVVYLKDGGKQIGMELAKELGIPARGLDISYPLSRRLNKAPRPLKVLAWPVKELIYRLSSPVSSEPFTGIGDIDRFALVDDSASSGKTLKAALRALRQVGIDRSRVKTATLRCGPRARPVVDFFEIEEPVLFSSR